MHGKRYAKLAREMMVAGTRLAQWFRQPRALAIELLGLGGERGFRSVTRHAERIYQMWDDALGKKDLEASLSLYADDASIESLLVQHLMKTKQGIVQGKHNLRKFITLVFATNPPQRKRFRTGFFSDGRLIMWEYPRATPQGDQMEFVEVMEVGDGLIARHRVYWGWHALDVLNGRQGILSPVRCLSLGSGPNKRSRPRQNHDESLLCGAVGRLHFGIGWGHGQ